MKFNPQKRYFKLIYNYGPKDWVVISEDDLEKVLFVRSEKKDIILNNKLISLDSRYFVIEPYYNYYLGWNEDRIPQDHYDFEAIKAKCPTFDGVLEYYRDRLLFLINNGLKNQIGKNYEISQIKLNKPQ